MKTIREIIDILLNMNDRDQESTFYIDEDKNCYIEDKTHIYKNQICRHYIGRCVNTRPET